MVFASLRSESRYTSYVARVMDRVLARAERSGRPCSRRPFRLTSDRCIIFSDVHRGAQNAADDFRQNERAYNAALAYYYSLGHTLILLGDVEDLWEEAAPVIFSAYPHTYELEAQFHRQGRYIRLWGNHDNDWRHAERVRQLLQPLYGEPKLHVCESVLLDIVEDVDPIRVDDGYAASEATQKTGADNVLGTLFFTHGHHGDKMSSRWAWFSRRVIRYLWRVYQRITQTAVNPPVTDWYLRHRLNRAMYVWAEQYQGMILVTGHTHAPVFRSRSHIVQIEEQIARLGREMGASPTEEQLRTLAMLRARLEWLMTRERRAERLVNGETFEKPCYFNPGCCCYSDGDITGLEIVDGEIRLVRWPDDEGDPRPNILTRDSLRDMLMSC